MTINSNTQSFTSLNGAIKVTKIDNTDSSSKKLSDAVSVNISSNAISNTSSLLSSLKEETVIQARNGYVNPDEAKRVKMLEDHYSKMNEENKFISAMCAAPIALEKAGVLENKNYTAYPGYNEKIKTSGTYLEDEVVVDGNLVTSRGPATAYAFAYKLVDVLGGDSLAVKNRMVYFNSFNVKEEK